MSAKVPRGMPRRLTFHWTPDKGELAAWIADRVAEGWTLDYGCPPDGAEAVINGRTVRVFALIETEAAR